ncbi:MAG: tRNA adenosine(34) deaminase TadA [Candidatus Hydrogenedentota bacterium]
MTTDIDTNFMKEALKDAEAAFNKGEVPVGAILVINNEIIERSGNTIQTEKNPLKHAEMIVINNVLTKLKCKYLYKATLYVTVEPCIMCTGAIILSRLGRLVYGADDPKTGACKSLYHVLTDRRLNHKVEVVSGICALECKSLMQKFFQNKRRLKD